MKDPADKLMRDMRHELDVVLAEMKEYDDAYKARQKRKKKEEGRHAQHRK